MRILSSLLIISLGYFLIACSSDDSSSARINCLKAFGGKDTNYFSYIEKTLEEGYIIAGSTHSLEEDKLDAWILKLDEYGEVLWEKTFSGTNKDRATVVRATDDGNYLIAITHMGVGYGNVRIIKLNQYGEILWDKNFSGSSFADFVYPMDILIIPDVGYLIVNSVISLSMDYRDTAWILELDINGNDVWQKIYEKDIHFIYAIELDSDGAYLLSGEISSERPGGNSLPTDAWVSKINHEGDVIWQNDFYIDYNFRNVAMGMYSTVDAGYLVVGKSSWETPPESPWIVKLDATGNLLEIIRIDIKLSNISTFQKLSTGDFIIAGASFTDIAYENSGWCCKVDEEGNKIWEHAYPLGGKYGSISNITETTDGGFAAVGDYESTDSENGIDAFILFLDADGNCINPVSEAEGTS